MMLLLFFTNGIALAGQEPAFVFANLQADYKSIESDSSRCERLSRLNPLLSELDAFVESHPSSELAARLVSGQTVDGINLDVLAKERKVLSVAVDQEARPLVISAGELLDELERATDWQPALRSLQTIEEVQKKLHQTYYCRSPQMKFDAIQIAALRTRFSDMREQDARRAIEETVVAAVISARAAGAACDKVARLHEAAKFFDGIAARFDGSSTVTRFREGSGDSTNSLTSLQDEIQAQGDACHVENETKNKKANVELIAVVSILKEANEAGPVKEKIRLYVAARGALDSLLSDHPASAVAKDIDRTGCFGKVCRQKITDNIDKLVEARESVSDHAFSQVKSLWDSVNDENRLSKRIEGYQQLISKLELFIENYSGLESVSILGSGGEFAGVSLKVAKDRLQTLLKERSQQASVERQEIINTLAAVETAIDANGRLALALQAQKILESLMALYSDTEISNQEGIRELTLKIENSVEKERLALESIAKAMFVRASLLHKTGMAENNDANVRRSALQESFEILEDIQTRFHLSTIGVGLADVDGFDGITLQSVQQSISDLEADTLMRRTAVASLLHLMQCGHDETQTFPKRIDCFRDALEFANDLDHKFPSVPFQVLCSSVGEACPGAGKSQFTNQITQLVASCEQDAKNLLRNAKGVIKAIEKDSAVASQGLGLLRDALTDIDAIASDFVCGTASTPVFDAEVAAVRDILVEAINEKKELFVVAQRKFVALQTLCGSANVKAQRAERQVGIAALDDCLRTSRRFATKFQGTKFGQVILKGGAFVPVLTRDEYRCEVQSGKKCFVRGAINQIDAKLVLDPTGKRIILTSEQARRFKLSKGIKITTQESGESQTLYVTHLDEVRFGPMRVRDVEAFVDPMATSDRVILGEDFLSRFDVEATQGTLVLRYVRPTGGVIANLGTAGLVDLRTKLMAEVVVIVETQLVKVMSLINDIRAIESVKRFGNRLTLIDEAETFVEKILNENELLEGQLEDKIDSIVVTLHGLKKATKAGREAAAIELCDGMRSDLSQSRNADSLSNIVTALDSIRNQLDDLKYFYDGTHLVTKLHRTPTNCGLSHEEIAEELGAVSQMNKAIACKASGLQSTVFGTRIKSYECALNELKKIERNYKKTIIGYRVRDNVVLTGVSKRVIEALIEKERRAKALIKRARAMIHEEVHDLGYSEKYFLMDEALVLLDELRDLKSTVELVELRDLKNEAREIYDDAELKIPIQPEIIVLPGQCYQMGSPTSDIDAASDEARHQVCVEDFGIGKFEVTFREYDQYVRATGADQPKDRGWGRGDRPVMYVSADDVEAYIEWLNKETGKSYRLPTEAEWEFAARGDNDARYAWGDNVEPGRANCLNCDSEWSGMSAPVGSFEPNAYGLYDMAGNVWERTCSIYRDKYDGSEGVCASSDVSGDRVLRGGSWKSHSRKLRSANRQPSLDPYVRSAYRGFRLAMDN